jgi:hypothetical protein
MPEESDFDKWFENPQNKKEREAAMERSGIPLETRARRSLRGLGYDAFRDFYEKDGISHELDVNLYKRFETIKLPYDFEATFYLCLLGECKRSETSDFFAFEAEERVFRTDYPIRLHREAVPNLDVAFPGDIFKFPFIAERIVEVEASSFKSRKQGNYGDRMTFEACESLVSACQFFQSFHSDFYFDAGWRMAAFDEIGDRYYSLEHEIGSIGAVDKIISEDPEQVFRLFTYFSGFLGVPIVILDDNRGLVKTVLSKDGRVSFEGEVEVVLYPHLIKDVARSREKGRGLDVVLPIVLCKHASLPKTVQLLEEGTRKILEQFKRDLQDDPARVIREMISTEAYLRKDTKGPT